MFLLYEQVVADANIKTVDDLNIPAKATHAMLQADTQPVRYTMDNATAPTSGVGMVLLITEPPALFLVEDLKRVKFTRGNAATDGKLNIHYFAGRNI